MNRERMRECETGEKDAGCGRQAERRDCVVKAAELQITQTVTFGSVGMLADASRAHLDVLL